MTELAAHNHRMSLLPMDVLRYAADALEAGLKDGRSVDDWRGHPSDSAARHLDAALRHIEQAQAGKVFDPDAKGVTHVGAAIARLCMWGFLELRKAEVLK